MIRLHFRLHAHECSVTKRFYCHPSNDTIVIQFHNLSNTFIFLYYNVMANYNGKWCKYNDGYDNFLKAIKKQGWLCDKREGSLDSQMQL